MERPSTLSCWIAAARPRTLFAGISPVAIGSAVAWSNGFFHLGYAALTLVCALLIQIGTNFANDYWDWRKGTDRQDRLGPPRVTSMGWLAPATVFRATVLIFLLAAVTGLFLVLRGGWPILVIGVLSIVCGVAYTAGRYALAYLGLGELFVLIFFGPVACLGTYYLQALSWNPVCFLLGLAAGCYSAALLVVNNLRDRQTDLGSGKRTLAVRFGSAFARREFGFFVLAPVLLTALAGWIGGMPVMWWILSSLMPAYWGLRLAVNFGNTPEGAAMNRYLGETGGVALAYTGLVSLAWIWGMNCPLAVAGSAL